MTQKKRIGRILKKFLFKLSSRNWIGSFVFYSKTYFVVSFFNKKHESVLESLSNLLKKRGFEVERFNVNNCYRFRGDGGAMSCNLKYDLTTVLKPKTKA
jgi:hypothetical protein